MSSQYGRERGGRPWALLRLSSQLPDLPRGRLGAPTAIYLTTGCGLSLCAEVPDSLEECLDLYCNAGANEVHPPPPPLPLPFPLPLALLYARCPSPPPSPAPTRSLLRPGRCAQPATCQRARASVRGPGRWAVWVAGVCCLLLILAAEGQEFSACNFTRQVSESLSTPERLRPAGSQGNKPPNVDIEGENVRAKSLSAARRLLLQAEGAGRVFWAALVVDAMTHPVRHLPAKSHF